MVAVIEKWFFKPEFRPQALELMQRMDELVGPPAHQDPGWCGHARFFRGEGTEAPVLMIYDWRSRESHQQLTLREDPLLKDFIREYCCAPRAISYHEELPVEVDHDEHAPAVPSLDLAGKAALVTGGSRGIGRAIAVRLAKGGADVVVNYRSDNAAAAGVVDAIQALGHRVVAVCTDVTQDTAAGQLVEATLKQFGRLDILVNNVGKFAFGRLDAVSPDQWDRVLRSNLTSVQFLCQAALPSLRAVRGSIVNIGLSPTYQIRAAANVGAYAIAKAGVLVLTRTLAAEQAASGVRVNIVSPGLIDNGILPPAQKTWMQKRVPMGRLGTPEEVAEAVAFLVSPAAGYISGANLAVAGAWDWEDRPTDHDGEVKRLFTEGGKE
jgi:3-oxoacyl-[acyl-carrier protein] reductase